MYGAGIHVHISNSQFLKCSVVTCAPSSLLDTSSLRVFCSLYYKPTNLNVTLVMEIGSLILVASHFTHHTSHLTLSLGALLQFDLCLSSRRNVVIPSPGYRYLQVSQFISKSRRKRPGICPEKGRYLSRRTRATSLVLTARGYSRTHSRGILSVLGQPWMALIRKERNCDRLASKLGPSLCSTI